MIVSPQKMKMTVLPSTHKMTDLDSIFPRVVILDIATHGHKKNMVFTPSDMPTSC
jgi:ABC-type multidrug transport system ATPase subunit